MKFNKGDVVLHKNNPYLEGEVVEDFKDWQNMRVSFTDKRDGVKSIKWAIKVDYALKEPPVLQPGIEVDTSINRTFQTGEVVFYNRGASPGWYTVVDSGTLYSTIQKGVTGTRTVQNKFLARTRSIELKTAEPEESTPIKVSPQLEFEWG